jgi:Cytochrome C oxidase, mono-heme subunit/FixO
MSLWKQHQTLEKNSILLVLGVLIVIAIGGVVEITPLFYLKNTIRIMPPIRMLGSQHANADLVRVRPDADLRRVDLRRDVAFERIADIDLSHGSLLITVAGAENLAALEMSCGAERLGPKFTHGRHS